MSPLRSASLPAHRPTTRAVWLAAIASIAAVALWWHGPIAQWADYHHFADARAWAAIPNAANVLSNLPFLFAGVWALWRLANTRACGPGHAAWTVFAAAVACTAFGSAVYHWAPSNDTLAFDRLPIAWACGALLCGLLAERVDARWSRPPVLASVLLLATGSVAAWWIGERHGHGDLRLYVAVQFLPMLLVPAALLLRLPATQPAVVPARDWCIVLALYAAAKGMEAADHGVLSSLGVVSGHTLKHLLAAGAAAWLLHAAVAISSGSRR
ncbi:MAG TPA: hypothetical protein VGP22_09595 [Albitalea sp.]|jgi:hypothetical protein|nr:hypothetical protein [Albitalea sp.]